MTNYLKWRLGALAFFVCALSFVIFGSHIEYVLDAVGLTGKKPIEDLDIPDLPSPGSKGGKKGKKAPISTGLRTVPTSVSKSLSCIRTTSPLTIDGLADDWSLMTGRFLCNDCVKNNSISSAWMHSMFDDDNFYVFSRVRHPEGLVGGTRIDSALKQQDFVQTRVLTADLATAINVWRNDAGKGMVQLHYFLPKKYRREIVKRDDDLFTAEDAIHRNDGVAAGVLIKVREHKDQRGADLECAIPWKLLCRDPANRPNVGDAIQMAFAARLDGKAEIHKLQLLTNKPSPLYRTYMIDREPANPPLVDVFSDVNPKGPKVFLTTLNRTQSRLEVDWNRSYHPEMVRNSELLVTPTTNPIVVDGADGEWPSVAEVYIGETITRHNGEVTLKTAADADKLYFHALINDVTPEGNGNALTLKIKTDTMHVIEAQMGKMTVDGADASSAGGDISCAIAPSHLSYSVEGAIPWKRLTATGKRPTSFAVTGNVSLNPVWSISGLFGTQMVTTEEGEREGWALARVLDKIPTARKPVVLTNNMYYDYNAGPPQRLRYDRGVVARTAHSLWNSGVDVLPGTATVDGGTDDWDLSGGMFVCNDVALYRDTNALWFHAMYDAERLYLLHRFIDDTPMANTQTKTYNRDDMAEFRIVLGEASIIVGQAVIGKTKSVHVAVKPGLDVKKDDPELATRVKAAYRKNADGTGYVLETSIPWSLLGEGATAPKAGETVPVYVLARTSPSMTLSDPHAFGAYSNVEKNPEYFGMAHFREKGPVKPRPCILGNGDVLPVIMRDGKPALDLSVLK